MTGQNIYDDPAFFAGYVTLDRQVRGLDGAAEWPTLSAMLPALTGRRVADLGCGFGGFSRWAIEQRAASVLGVDVSTKMLERANSYGSPDTIEYRRADLDELELAPDSVDVAFSSLTMHYVHDLARLLSTITRSLSAGGSLVFSVEHPIFSAPTTQKFATGDHGGPVWPLDNYLVEGRRVTSWFVDGVVKEHRTVATYVNAVIDAGLTLDHMVEWGPTAADIEARPELAKDLHRPWFLLVRATKPDASR